MRSLTMFFACALLATSLASCLRDTCEAEVEYIRYDPIYVQAASFRTEIGPEAPRELEMYLFIYNLV